MADDGYGHQPYPSADLNRVKNDYGIASGYQSCHTAVTSEGCVFEGHIPARVVQPLLENPPEAAIGLSVPGMPAGSPGMAMGDRFMPNQVWLLKQDSLAEVFASVISRDQQQGI
ncbi:hypothetical protein G8770_00150 [Aestuariicella hydrocarbonica]|uniref:Metal-binding protein n=2 Tax=Pseudomaricurvus hydrocarbonicus TaxID=1470433 RepID=A0A9E5JR10_9GAMM|nr:hypothetical protein [Aestuariicella hydrocarbonica]